MAHTRTWNAAYEANPSNSQDASQGAARIRELKLDVKERLALDHVMDETDDDGYHVQVTLEEQAGAPGNLANKVRLYALEVASKSELHFKDEDGNVIILTNAGKLKVLDTINAWTAGQSVAETAIAYAATITPDCDDGNRFIVAALTGNVQLDPPSNPKAGQVITIRFKQDATGSRLLTFGTTIYGNDALDWALSTGANEVDELVMEYDGEDSRWRALALHKDIDNAL
jgi:hypothetical protein